jgi:hypothetical protein
VYSVNKSSTKFYVARDGISQIGIGSPAHPSYSQAPLERANAIPAYICM